MPCIVEFIPALALSHCSIESLIYCRANEEEPLSRTNLIKEYFVICKQISPLWPFSQSMNNSRVRKQPPCKPLYSGGMTVLLAANAHSQRKWAIFGCWEDDVIKLAPCLIGTMPSSLKVQRCSLSGSEIYPDINAKLCHMCKCGVKPTRSSIRLYNYQ